MKRGILIAISLSVLVAFCVLGRQSAVEVGSLHQNDITVVIDPGHGGFDGGAVSVLGDKECDINLAIAQKTDALFAFCGVPTVLLRQKDEALASKKAEDLRARVQTVNDTPDGVLLSIHQNTFPEGKYHGAQVFYSLGSEVWAEQTQDSLISLVDPENNRVPKPGSGIYLLENIKKPGILVECGFLSNEMEAKILKDDTYQRELALAMVAGLHQWRQEGNTDEV